MIWFTSDTHFFHKGVIEYCNRPWSSLEEMHEGMIKNWNQRVNKKEVIYILGDFCFATGPRLRDLVSRLNGQKILVTGNHDTTARRYLDAGFHDVLENEQITLPNGRDVLLSHFPYLPNDIEQQLCAGVELDRRYLHKRITRLDDTWLLHGHVHQSWKINQRQLNVGVDVWDWAPVAHETIQRVIDHWEAGLCTG